MKIESIVSNGFARMKKWYMSGLDKRQPVNTMLVGPAGCGKSTIVEQFCTANNLGYVEFIVSQREAYDVNGMGVPQRRADGLAPDLVFTRSPLMRMIEEQQALGKKGGIIFLDEYYSGEKDIRKALSQFLTSRRLGADKLPEGWVVWGACNPPEWRNAGTPMGHEPTRWANKTVTPDPEGWGTWALENSIHPLYVSWAKKFWTEVGGVTPPKDKWNPHCNPRSLVSAHAIHSLGVTGNNLATDEDAREEVAGTIGESATHSLFAFLKVQDCMPSPEEMMENPEGCALPPVERLDAVYACMMQAVTYTEATNADDIFRFVQRLPKDMAATYIQTIGKLPGMAKSLQSPRIAQFVAANPQLLMATANIKR